MNKMLTIPAHCIGKLSPEGWVEEPTAEEIDDAIAAENA